MSIVFSPVQASDQVLYAKKSCQVHLTNRVPELTDLTGTDTTVESVRVT